MFLININLANKIEYNILGTCQYNQRNIKIVSKTRGPNITALKVKSRKIKRSNIITDIPKKINDAYSKVHFDIDIIHVNGCAYFTAISQHICLINYYPIASRIKKEEYDGVDYYRVQKK